MGKLDFVDTHVHFWDLDQPDLKYTWLEPDSFHPQIGTQLDKLKGKNFVAEDLIAETRGSNVTKIVHVQAALGIEDPVKETEWLSQAAERTGWPNGIVAYSNLKSPSVEEELARHCEFPQVVGIRDFSEGDYLVDSDFHRGYALLEKYGLAASLDVEWQNMVKMRDLASRFSNTIAVLDHCGFPKERTDEYFEAWKKGMTALAEADNVVCKISGLGNVRLELDDRQHPAVGDALHRGVRPGALHLRDELARRQAVQHLRRSDRRVYQDHLRVQPGRAGGDVLGQRREALRHIAFDAVHRPEVVRIDRPGQRRTGRTSENDDGKRHRV